MDAKTDDKSAGKCPVVHTSFRYRDWWPNTLDLSVLHHHSALADPMGEAFDYAKEFKSLPGNAVIKDLRALMTNSQQWWPEPDECLGQSDDHSSGVKTLRRTFSSFFQVATRSTRVSNHTSESLSSSARPLARRAFRRATQQRPRVPRSLSGNRPGARHDPTMISDPPCWPKRWGYLVSTATPASRGQDTEPRLPISRFCPCTQPA